MIYTRTCTNISKHVDSTCSWYTAEVVDMTKNPNTSINLMKSLNSILNNINTNFPVTETPGRGEIIKITVNNMHATVSKMSGLNYQKN